MEYFDYSIDDVDIEQLLEASNEREAERVEAELRRIEEQLDQRGRLHEEITEDLEAKLEWYTDRLADAYRRNSGDDVEMLKAEIRRFYEEIRTEKQQHWRDRQELEQARRRLLRERAELDESVLEWLSSSE